MITFNIDGMTTPNFSFKSPIMSHIFKNVQLQQLIKLYQCSKYFYAKFRQNIIQHLEIIPNKENEILSPIKTVIHLNNPALKKFADFWISESFVFRGPLAALPTFTNFTPKILILQGYVYLADYKLFAKAGTIKELKVENIANGELGFAAIDDIIAEVPNATSIEISHSRFNNNTCASLIALNRNAKFSHLVLQNITPYHLLNCDLLINFVLVNADDNCNVQIGFKLVPEINDFHRQLNEQYVDLGKRIYEVIAIQLKNRKL